MQTIEQEMNIMRKAIGLIIMLGLVGCASLDKQPGEVTVEFRLAETESAEGLTEMTFEFTGEKFYLHDETVLSNDDVVLASVSKGDFWPVIDVTLTSDGAERFAQVTGDNISKHMAIVVGGELVSCPKINAQILGGRAQITGDFTEEEAKRIATGITQLRNPRD
jgi:preprotein translocase subunit SecD